MSSLTPPDILLHTLLKDERISIAEAIPALHLLAPMIADERAGGPTRDLAGKILGRIDDPDEEVLYLLDWWYYVTTNRQSDAGRLYRIPPSLDTGLVSALEALRDVDVAAAPARWLRAKRELPKLVASLEDRLDLDSYGSVKLPSEREAWTEFCESIDPVRAALEANHRTDSAVLQEDGLAKVMRQLGIDENSARWRQVFDRMRAATDHINRCVEVQHLAEPWKRNVDVPTVDSISAGLEARLGSMAGLVFAPLRETTDPAVDYETEVAGQLEELAQAADDRQKVVLANLVGAWIEDRSLPVPTLQHLMERRRSILERRDRLDRQGVDVFEVDYHLEDSNLGEAESALKRADAGRLVTEKKAKLERQLASVEERGAQLAEEVPDHLATTIAKARELLASENPDGASELLRNAQETLGNLEHAASVAELERLIGDLDAMQAPPSTIYDYRKQLDELRGGPTDAAGAREIVASIRHTVSSFGEGRREDTQRRIQRIEDVLEEAAGGSR